MKSVEPPICYQSLIERFHECGGVLKFEFVDTSGDKRPAEDIHREAAQLALRALKARMDRQAEDLVRKYDGPPEHIWRMTIVDGWVPSGQPISLDQFFLGPTRYGPAPEDVAAGFTHAFNDPPYGLKDSDWLFSQMKSVIFRGFAEETEVWRWDTDGSNFFDEGKEWWGAFFWTCVLSRVK